MITVLKGPSDAYAVCKCPYCNSIFTYDKDDLTRKIRIVKELYYDIGSGSYIPEGTEVPYYSLNCPICKEELK